MLVFLLYILIGFGVSGFIIRVYNDSSESLDNYDVLFIIVVCTLLYPFLIAMVVGASLTITPDKEDD